MVQPRPVRLMSMNAIHRRLIALLTQKCRASTCLVHTYAVTAHTVSKSVNMVYIFQFEIAFAAALIFQI